MLRRELIEGAEVKAGDQALVLCETNPPGGIEAVVGVAAEILHELGAHVAEMRVDELIPVRAGTAQGAWTLVEHHKIPDTLFQAIRGADVVLDYTVNSRGGQKYNQDFYNLGMYYGKRICAYRAAEAPEALSRDPSAPVAYSDALRFPSDLLRVIAATVNESLVTAAEANHEFHMTNPWGTDLRFTVLPGDISSPFGGIREYPSTGRFDFAGDDSRRLWRALTGFAVTQTCEGLWVTRHCSLIGGELRDPLTVHLKDGSIVAAEGGPQADRLMGLITDELSAVHAILMGLNPKASPFRDGRYLLANNGAGVGVCHVALGGPGLFFHAGRWAPVGNKHFQLGNIPKISLWAGADCVVQDGSLLALQHPAVRYAARQYGDPDDLLRQFDWPADMPLG